LLEKIGVLLMDWSVGLTWSERRRSGTLLVERAMEYLDLCGDYYL